MVGDMKEAEKPKMEEVLEKEEYADVTLKRKTVGGKMVKDAAEP